MAQGSILGLDIGGTQIKAVRAGPGGDVLKSTRAPTPGSLAEFRTQIGKLVLELVSDEAPPAGIGIGCKGIINPETARVEVLPGTLQYLEGHTLLEFVSPWVPDGTPVAADNYARAALAGEAAWGAARGREDVVMLTLGTGVGGAVLADGKLLRGTKGIAGHLGHLTADPDGSPCICGNRGCLETVFSSRAIEAEAFAVAHRGVACRLTSEAGNGPLSCEAIFRIAAEGDPIARQIVDRATRCLGAAMAGLAHAFDPEIFILGGQIANVGERLLRAVAQEVAWRSRTLLQREVPVVAAQLGESGGAVGAAALVLEAVA